MTTEPRPQPCEAGACVGVQITDTGVAIRDTKQLISPVLTLDHDGWRRIVGSVHLASHPRCVAIVGDDYIWVGHDTNGNLTTLTFTHDEIRAFVTAIHHGQHRVPAVAR